MEKVMRFMGVSEKYFSFLALCLGFFMVVTDVTIVNVSLPNIAKSLNTDLSGLQWVIAGYSLSFSCLLLSAGSWGDYLGARNTFVSGLILFVISSFFCGISSSIATLIFARIMQGVGAALLVPTTIILIKALFTDKAECSRAIGIWASIGGIAGLVGPVLGGVLTSYFSWRSIFIINIPIGMFAIFFTMGYLPKPAPLIKRKIDIFGQAFVTIAIAALAFSLIEAGALGWFSHLILMTMTVFFVSFIIFIFIESYVKEPMLPLSFFKSNIFMLGIIIGLIINLGGYGEFFVLSLFFQQIKGYPVLTTGFALLPYIGMGTIGSYFGGKVTSLHGSRFTILLGLTISFIGYTSFLIINSFTSDYLFLAVSLAAIGFGLTFLIPAVTTATIHAVSENHTGIASGVFNASRQMGSLLGVALFGTIINASSTFVYGMHLTFFISAITILIAYVAAFVCTK